jgi:ankyrin repeat protein
VEASARNNVNIETIFYGVVRMIREQRKLASTQRPPGVLTSPGTPYHVRRSWWRKSVFINPEEGQSEAGRKRLTYSLVDAAKSNLEREVLAFLDAGANINDQPGSDGAAIHAASASGHANVVNILIKRGAAINAKGPSGTSPLQIAAAEGHLAVLRLLLHKGAQIDQTSRLHGCALSAASSRGRLEVVRYLLKKRANVNVVGGPYGNALQAAAWAGKASIVELLLGAGADIDARGAGECTALQIAAFAGHANVIRSLLKLGGTININAPGGKYGCARKAANDHGHFEALMVLIEAGATDPPPPADALELENHSSEPAMPSPTSVYSAVSIDNSTTGMPPEEELDAIVLSTKVGQRSDSYLKTLGTANTGLSERSRLPRPPLLVEKPQINPVGFSYVSNPKDATAE